jgi:hypothetical protein
MMPTTKKLVSAGSAVKQERGGSGMGGDEGWIVSFDDQALLPARDGPAAQGQQLVTLIANVASSV